MAENRHILRISRGLWERAGTTPLYRRDPSPEVEGSIQSSSSPWIVPRHSGLGPRSSSCLGKHQQSKACSARTSLTPPYPQKKKYRGKEKKKKEKTKKTNKKT